MCPSCHSNDVSRSRRRKLKDSFMRWMGKVAYRCRDCQKRFYVAIDVDRRLSAAQEWRKRSQEHAGASGVRNTPEENEFAAESESET
jgi:hypothetical protein